MALSDKDIERENEFLKGLPRMNWGAFLLPPIWGAAHGMWATVLFYPMWLVADNVFYAAYSERTFLAIVFAAVIFAALVASTIAFGLVAQPLAAHRAEAKGVSRERYLRQQRWWAIGCAIAGAIMIVLASYYNLVIRPTMGA